MATTFRGESPTDQYFIQDTRTCCGNDVLWWRPNGCGYTTDMDHAGIYSRKEADGKRPTDHAWPIEQVIPLAHRVVDLQKLPKRDL